MEEENLQAHTFLTDLADFSAETLAWCRRESENSISKINDIISVLLDDASRVSAISEETLDAISSMREIIDSLNNDRRDIANDLAKILQKTSNENNEIHNFIQPIMETLQFQDRISQNMDNLSSMIRIWLVERSRLGGVELSDDDLRVLGEKLLKKTTMQEERDIIREKIKNLEPEPEKAETNVLFF